MSDVGSDVPQDGGDASEAGFLPGALVICVDDRFYGDTTWLGRVLWRLLNGSDPVLGGAYRITRVTRDYGTIWLGLGGTAPGKDWLGRHFRLVKNCEEALKAPDKDWQKPPPEAEPSWRQNSARMFRAAGRS